MVADAPGLETFWLAQGDEASRSRDRFAKIALYGIGEIKSAIPAPGRLQSSGCAGLASEGTTLACRSKSF